MPNWQPSHTHRATKTSPCPAPSTISMSIFPSLKFNVYFRKLLHRLYLFSRWFSNVISFVSENTWRKTFGTINFLVTFCFWGGWEDIYVWFFSLFGRFPGGNLFQIFWINESMLQFYLHLLSTFMLLNWMVL